MKHTLTLVLLALTISLLTGCYSVRPSDGGSESAAPPERRIDALDVALPHGYAIVAVAHQLTYPTDVVFDDQGRVYVVEAGYSYGEDWTVPRLLRIETDGQTTTIASGTTNGPWTGACFMNGSFFVSEGGQGEGGKILRIGSDGAITTLVERLPSLGDHHTDQPVRGPDGWLYFGQGTTCNSGIVGPDNAKFGWLKRHPEVHDIPGADIELAGVNIETPNPLTDDKTDKAMTGAFVPFGTKTTRGQIIKGQIPCNGAIMRIKPEGGQLELVAWGFRNPFGLAFSPEGDLYATDNGYDERGSRPIWGVGDLLWRVKRGAWHGWPDYFGDDPVTQKRYAAPGKPVPAALLAKPPNIPPKPVAWLAVHSSADGFDFSRNDRFGHRGEAFIALFGDQAPGVGKILHPAGYKVVRVNVQTGVIDDFAINKGKSNGPASTLKTGGLERPVSAKFDSKGDALYVVDFGIMLNDSKGAKPVRKTGVLWRITRQEESQEKAK